MLKKKNCDLKTKKTDLRGNKHATSEWTGYSPCVCESVRTGEKKNHSVFPMCW